MAVEFGQSSIKEWLMDTQERSTIEDAVQHGCQGGTISELIYYVDTEAFYEKYKEEICVGNSLSIFLNRPWRTFPGPTSMTSERLELIIFCII